MGVVKMSDPVMAAKTQPLVGHFTPLVENN
jgi:hypothetical protein